MSTYNMPSGVTTNDIPGNDIDAACETSRADLAARARQYYEEVSTAACHSYSVIPEAIDAWEREPDLLEALQALCKTVEGFGDEWSSLSYQKARAVIEKTKG